MKYPILFLFILFFAFACQVNVIGQSRGERYIINGEVYNSSILVNPENFIPELLENAILDEINKMRLKNYVEPVEVVELLEKAAKDQAIYMAENEKETSIRQEKEKTTTADRLTFYGASTKGEELTGKAITNKGGEYFAYYKIAYDIVFKWFLSSKTESLLLSKEVVFVGIANAINQSGSTIYISLILGNYDSFNEGVTLKSKLEIPITEKIFGTKPYDERECKKLEKFDHLENLLQGISIQNSDIYFQYDDLRYLKRIFRNSKDGILVDLVLKKQYECGQTNIIDNNLPNKGVVLEKVYTKKLFKNNLIEDKQTNNFKTIIGELPENIKDNFEINLILLQNKHTCINLNKTFIIGGDDKLTTNVELLADTITINSEFEYKPSTDTTFLSFRIPFEKRKYTFKTSDIQPLIDSLKEPDFQIHELVISAYSSVEGTNEENEMLQKKRAESIINAIKTLQNEDIISRINTGDNWELFKNDVLKTEFKSLANMSIDEAQSYLNKINLNEELENILSKHRYAQVDMKVTYNIEGKYEQQFVLSEFNKAITKNDLPLALSIQKFIFKKILNNNYNSVAVYDQIIPYEPDFAGLIMNKIWLEKYVSKSSLENYEDRIIKLYDLNNSNDYIKFNFLLLSIKKTENFDARKIREIQGIIDELYFSTFTKKTVDALNLMFQLTIIDKLNKENFEKTIEESLVRIKTIIEIKYLNTQDALRLAYLFIKHSDYNYAFQLIDPFVLKTEASEDFIFTYLSLCSHGKSRIYSNRFLMALEKANYLNHERFCQLFNGEYFSFQVFDNLKAKEYYCKTCFSEGNN